MPDFLIAFFDIALASCLAVAFTFYGYLIWSAITRDPPEPHSHA